MTASPWESLPTLATACAGSQFPAELPVYPFPYPVPWTFAPNPAHRKTMHVPYWLK
jgi:hypothetical protein